MFDVASLQRQQHELFVRLQHAEWKAAQAVGQRAETTAKINSPGKTYRLRGGWKYRCWRTGGAVMGELTNDVKHSLFIERGTGLYGPKRAKYPIVPRRKKYLSWTVGGSFGVSGTRFFAKKVMHPGVKPRFIGRAAMFGSTSPFVGEGHDKNITTIERELQKAA
jgi:hypothetical protein